MRTLCLVGTLLALTTSVTLADEPQSAPGLIWSSRGAVLTRVDALSRRPLPNAPSVLLGYAHYALSTSPDGALLASTSGIDRQVHISDLTGLNRTWTIGPLPQRPTSTFWIGRRTLVASSNSTSVALLDVAARRVVRQIPVSGVIIAEAATGGHYVALVAPAKRIGALELVSIAASGRTSTTAIPAIRGGNAFTSTRVWRSALPGIALSPGGTRAYIVARGGRVVEADLTTQSARTLALRAGRTPQMASKLQAGWQRTSRLLGSGTLVSTGSDLSGREYTSFLGGDAAGLRITDLTTRRTHVAMPGANQFRICGGLIVAARYKAEPGAAAVVGLDRKGRQLWSQYAGQGVVLAGCTATYVYFQIPGNGIATLDVRTGAVLEAHRGSAAAVIELS